MTNDVKRILVVRTDRIGDVILTTPAIEVLRKNFPDAQISMLAATQTRFLLEGNPYVDKVFVDDRGKDHKGVLGFWRLVFLLRSQKFDWAIVFHTKRRTNLLCWLAGIPKRSGYCNEKYGFLLTDKIFDTRNEGHQHESSYCISLLRELGLFVPKEQVHPYIPVSSSARHWAQGWIERHGIKPKTAFIINASASHPSRLWPYERFAGLIEKMHAQHLGPIIIVGLKDCKTTKNLISLVAPKVIDMTGETSLEQLIALLSLSRMLISNDTGPVHIASALGLAVVSVFVRNQPGMNVERWHPLSDKYRAVARPWTETQALGLKHVKDHEAIADIPVESVWEAVDGLLKLC